MILPIYRWRVTRLGIWFASGAMWVWWWQRRAVPCVIYDADIQSGFASYRAWKRWWLAYIADNNQPGR